MDYIKELDTGIYRITSDGRVFSKPKRKIPICGKNREFTGNFYYQIGKEKELTYRVNNRGYNTVSFNHTTYMVHRLVAEGYVNNPDPTVKKYVNHIDGDKLNNCASNLEWCTIKENNDHARRTGLWIQPKGYKIKYKSKASKKKSLANLKDTTILTKEQILFARSHVQYHKKGSPYSVTNMANTFGVSATALSNAIKGKTFKNI